jgi:hypothetical protein
MPIANNNKMILYGGIGLAVLVVIIIAFMMMRKKEGFNSWSSYQSSLPNPTSTYTPGPSAMGTANYAQGSSLMLESDLNGNLNTTASLPIGAIIIWYGQLNTIPVGWALCDGSNGTPSLSGGIFPRGAGGDADLGTTGGGSTSITLVPENIPLVTTCVGGNCQIDVTPSTTVVPVQAAGGVTYAARSYIDSNGGFKLGGTPASISITTTPRYFSIFYIMKMQ